MESPMGKVRNRADLPARHWRFEAQIKLNSPPMILARNVKVSVVHVAILV